jgi:hypothetical protein
MEISLNELRLALDIALKDIERTVGLSKIVINEDYYWTVSAEKRYDFRSDPPEPDCGQLFDDVQWLKNELSKGHGTYTSLMFLVGILDYISSRSLAELSEMLTK